MLGISVQIIVVADESMIQIGVDTLLSCAGSVGWGVRFGVGPVVGLLVGCSVEFGVGPEVGSFVGCSVGPGVG